MITAQEAREIAEKKNADDKSRRQREEEEYRQASGDWAKERFPSKVESVLKQIGSFSKRGETNADIALEVVNEELREILLANLVIKKLQELGYVVYQHQYKDLSRCKVVNDYIEGPIIRKYCVSWSDKQPDWLLSLRHPYAMLVATTQKEA